MSWRWLGAFSTRAAFHLFRRSRIASNSIRLQKASGTILFCSILYPPLSSLHNRQRTDYKLAKTRGSLPAFRYDPLPIIDPDNATNPTFRLLKLHPGQDDEEVVCALMESHLLHHVPYETVSYRWDADRADVICEQTDGSKSALSIPGSLSGALRALRHPDRARFLWADAICINQNDDTEKANQVQLMREIYSLADGVLIWLGESPGEGDSDFSVSVPAKLAITIGLVSLSPMMKESNIPSVLIKDVREGTAKNFAPFSVELYLQLIGLLRKPWFGRAWVVQEVVVSKKATAVWGSKQCDWNELIQALKFMSKAKFPLAFMPTLQHIAGIEEERNRYNRGTNTLLGLLLRHQRCETTKRRDKVYAFCGLVDTSPPNFINISYDERYTIESVYRDVATTILQHDKNLDILSHAPLPENISSKLCLPSWIPDWSLCTSKNMAYAWGIGPLSLVGREIDSQYPPKSPFTATKDSTYTPSSSSSKNSLIVSGHVFDTVTATGPVLYGVQIPSTVTTLRGIVQSWLDTLDTFLQTRSVLLAWKDIAYARSQTYYAPSNHHDNAKINTDEPILTAFYRTIYTSAYEKSSMISNEVHLWDLVNRPFPVLQKLHLDTIMVKPFSAILLLWYGITKGPLLKLELQRRHALYRRFITTERGYIGLAGNRVRPGDQVVLCQGSKVPLVFRLVEKSESKETDRWRLVGDAYVHGIMNGDGFDESACKSMILV